LIFMRFYAVERKYEEETAVEEETMQKADSSISARGERAKV